DARRRGRTAGQAALGLRVGGGAGGREAHGGDRGEEDPSTLLTQHVSIRCGGLSGSVKPSQRDRTIQVPGIPWEGGPGCACLATLETLETTPRNAKPLVAEADGNRTRQAAFAASPVLQFGDGRVA